MDLLTKGGGGEERLVNSLENCKQNFTFVSTRLVLLIVKK